MHVKAVEGILEQLELSEIPRLLLLNKADILDLEQRADLRERYPDALFLSAVSGQGLEDLAKAVVSRIDWSGAVRMDALGEPDDAEAGRSEEEGS